MIQYQLKQDKDRKMPQACGKWSAALVERRIVDKEGLAEHMAASRTRTIKNSVVSPNARYLLPCEIKPREAGSVIGV